jgi:hypothetical protein
MGQLIVLFSRHFSIPKERREEETQMGASERCPRAISLTPRLHPVSGENHQIPTVSDSFPRTIGRLAGQRPDGPQIPLKFFTGQAAKKNLHCDQQSTKHGVPYGFNCF